MRALIVDDSQYLRRGVADALASYGGMECVEAEDGAAAVRKLQAMRFDVVVTDLNMPVLDGLKLIAWIRQSRAAVGDLPIVVITTESSALDRQRALRLGATTYLVKPVQAQQVVTTVTSLLAPPQAASR